MVRTPAVTETGSRAARCSRPATAVRRWGGGRSYHRLWIGELQPECLRDAWVHHLPFDDIEPQEQARILFARRFPAEPREPFGVREGDRKSTRLNSSHVELSYA